MKDDRIIHIKCTKSTIIRTVLLIVALINNCLVIFDHSVLPFDNETVEQAVSAIFTGVTSMMTWWKNNSFSEAAHMADKHLEEIKNSKKDNS